jgi:uncharacterized protein YndB with AHSA1/START domain
MPDKNFTATIEVYKSPQNVFKSITNDVAKWWGGKDLEGESINLNDEFIINHPGAHYSKQKLVEVVPGKKIAWLVTDRGVTPDSECYESYKPGWTHHLEDSLLKPIDAGKGFPE